MPSSGYSGSAAGDQHAVGNLRARDLGSLGSCLDRAGQPRLVPAYTAARAKALGAGLHLKKPNPSLGSLRTGNQLRVLVDRVVV